MYSVVARVNRVDYGGNYETAVSVATAVNMFYCTLNDITTVSEWRQAIKDRVIQEMAVEGPKGLIVCIPKNILNDMDEDFKPIKSED
jgi:hypothetical protein